MAQWLNAFLIILMVIAVWPSVLYFVRELSVPIKILRPAKGVLVSRYSPHPADPPACMAKLIMLRHRIQQANARRSNQRILPLTRPNLHLDVHSRHRAVQNGWINQTNHARVPNRQWGTHAR